MQKSKFTKLIALSFLIIFSINLTVYAVSDDSDDLEGIKQSLEAYQQREIDRMGSRKVVMENRAEKLKSMLLDSFESFDDAENQIEQYQKELEPIKQKITTLKEQIKNLDYELDKTNTKIANIKLMIAKREIDIAKLMEKIEKSNIEMDAQKNMIEHYLQMSYREEQKFKSKDEDKNLINLLLADANASESMQKEVYFDVMEDTRRQIFYKLALAKNEFQNNQKKYEKMREGLNDLDGLLEKEKDNLKLQQIAKEDLLLETEGREVEYQKMLEESKKQQEESAFEIENLQNNLELIREKLKGLNEDEVKLKERVQEIKQVKEDANEQVNVEYSLDFADEENSDNFFIWPVSPSGGITAFYQDPSYKAHFGVAHSAIDIRQRQGSPVFAPANGYVYKAKDNGMGYSYIILAHKDGFMTVYGHVSEFMVEEGDLVHTGDLIGLSGGMPGTKGAGWMTTGPHLHYEIYKDGVHVNPLDYMPLEDLPIEYIPAEYLKTLKLK